MDELVYLDRIDNIMAHIMEEWNDIPLYDQIFEASDEEVEKANDLGDKSTSLLQKAIGAVKALFRKVKEVISNAIDYLFAGKEEQQSFEDFIKEVKSDPELAKMKVTFHDYRNIISGLDKDCKEFESKYQQFKQSEADEAPSLEKAITERVDDYAEKFKAIAAAEGTSAAVEAMIVYAQQNRINAIKVQGMIDVDLGLIEALESELSKKDVQRFKKKIKHLNSSLNIVRRIHGGRQLQGKGIEEALKEVKSKWTHLLRIHGRARRSKHKDQVKDAEKGILKTGIFLKSHKKEIKKDITNIKAAKTEKKAARMEKKNARMDRKITNKTNDLIDKASKMATDGGK